MDKFNLGADLVMKSHNDDEVYVLTVIIIRLTVEPWVKIGVGQAQILKYLRFIALGRVLCLLAHHIEIIVWIVVVVGMGLLLLLWWLFACEDLFEKWICLFHLSEFN